MANESSQKFLHRTSRPRVVIDYAVDPVSVEAIVAAVSAATGIATVAVKGIQLWIEERKSRSIKVRRGDYEIEIHGAVSEEQLRRQLELFAEYESSEGPLEIEVAE